MSSRSPDFLIIGAQKAGTTALSTMLRDHPDAWLPVDEDHALRDPFFDADTHEAWRRGYAARSEKRVGLKCPQYLAAPEVPARVRTLLGTPDVIVCLRDPVKRFLAGYFWYMRWGVIPLAPPEVGVPRLLRGDYDHLPMAREIIELGRYAQHLRRWFDHVPQERCHVLLQEDLRDEKDKTLRALLEFLSLSPDPPGGVALPSRANVTVYPMARMRFLQLQARLVGTWDPTHTYLLLEPRNRGTRFLAKAIAGVDRYGLRFLLGNKPPPTSASLLSRISEVYADDVADLEGLIGRDLSAWRR